MKLPFLWFAVLAVLASVTNVAGADSVIITADVFAAASSETFSVGNSQGDEARNRAALPVSGTVRNLYVQANQQPSAGSITTACVRINGVDTSLCTTYTSADWPGVKGNAVNTVAVSRGDVFTVKFTESGGVSSGANIRAAVEIGGDAAPVDRIFANGFETSIEAHAALITGEPFLLDNGDSYSIASTVGEEIRNRAAAPRDGVLNSLYILPNLQPAAGSLIQVCARVNGADTSLCASYTNADWPGPKSDTSTTVPVNQGDLISVRFRELNGVNSGANVRASIDVGGSAGSGAVVVTAEPFLVDSGEVFTIGGSAGEESRNSAAIPRSGTIRNLSLIPNLQPAAGSAIVGCIRVNGVDSSLCANYTAASWPAAVTNTAVAVPVQQGDVVTVRFRELNGVVTGANTRASFTFE